MSTPHLPSSLAGVAAVEVLRGAQADPAATPDLLVEVPHGADEQEHYDALRARLGGPLPEGLEIFFWVNTDVGAWHYGRAAAELLLAAEPTRSALLVRSLIPRTFIDCNRPATGESDLSAGVTAGVPAYVTNPSDLELLCELHRQYVELAGAAYAAVCGAGGLALVPHTYAPHSIGISSVGLDIVEQLRWAYEPAQLATWPLRAEVDLLTRDGEGVLLGPAGAEEELVAAYAAAGLEAKANDTYYLHPGTLGHGWSAAYPGRTLCLEVRRDLLVDEWLPFSAKAISPAGVERVAAPLIPTLARLLAERAASSPAER